MTDISKLKAEAEDARNDVAQRLGNLLSFSKAQDIADALIRATIAQIALQAAEKEAEARKYEPKAWDVKKLESMVPVTDQGFIDSIKQVRNSVETIRDADKTAADAQGWINWEGGECPVDGAAIVATKWRDGRANKPSAAYHSLWHHDGRYDDIIAYRIILPAADRVSES